MTVRAGLWAIVFAAGCLLGSVRVATAEQSAVLYSDPIEPQENQGVFVFCTVLNISERPINGEIQILRVTKQSTIPATGATFTDVGSSQVTAIGGGWVDGFAFCRVRFNGKPDDVRANIRADAPEGVPVIGPLPLR